MGTVEKKQGFTLIEIVIVIGVITMVLPVLFGIIFGILRQQLRIYALMEVKRQGDFTMNKIKTVVQENAVDMIEPTAFAANPETVSNICPLLTSPIPTPFPAIYFRDKDNKVFSYRSVSPTPPGPTGMNLVESTNGGIVQMLSNSKVSVNNLRFTCYKTNSFSPPVLSVSFTVKKTGSFEDTFELPYQSKIKLRSY